MRHGTTNRRQRNRGNGGRNRSRGNQPRMQVYDSNGPDVRIRGTAHQVAEKYATLAKDAASSGDRVLAESYLQHAEHYQRIITSWNDEPQGSKPQERERGHQEKNAEPALGNSKEQLEAKDDLSLPASILGDVSSATPKEDEQERTPETTDS